VEGRPGSSSTCLAALALLLWLAPAAAAQDLSYRFPRVDLSAMTGWLGHHPSDDGLDRDDWNNRWYGGTQIGLYWTEHLKTELNVGLTNEGESWAVYPVLISPRPGSAQFTNENRRQRDVTLSVGQSWQFLRNQWVHPFVAAGVDASHARVVRELHTFEPANGGLPQIARLEDERWHAGVHGAAGVKVYFTTRSFVRFDGSVAFGQDGQHVLWRVGLGRDF
jgi:outer membrane protein with beta-barrel domain